MPVACQCSLSVLLRTVLSCSLLCLCGCAESVCFGSALCHWSLDAPPYVRPRVRHTCCDTSECVCCRGAATAVGWKGGERGAVTGGESAGMCMCVCVHGVHAPKRVIEAATRTVRSWSHMRVCCSHPWLHGECWPVCCKGLWCCGACPLGLAARAAPIAVCRHRAQWRFGGRCRLEHAEWPSATPQPQAARPAIVPTPAPTPAPAPASAPASERASPSQGVAP